MERIKVVLQNPEYFVNGKYTVCKVEAFAVFRDYSLALGVIKGITVCDSSDIYNEDIGKRIALAKAETKAYNKAISKIQKDLCKMKIQCLIAKELYNDFDDRTSRIIEHNRDYIKEITK